MKYIITLSLVFSFSALASNHLSSEKLENIKLIKIIKKLPALAETMPKPRAKPTIGMETPINEGGGGGSMGGGGGGK